MSTLDAGPGQVDHGQNGHGHDHGQPLEVSVAEAAQALGVSVKTVRRRVQAGQLRSRTVRGRNGVELRIVLDQGHDHGQRDHGQPDQGRDHGQPSSVVNGHSRVDFTTLVNLVDKLTQQNLEMAGRVGYLQAELTQAREQIKALQAPKEPAPSPPSAGPLFAPLPAEPDPPRRPWWKLW